LDSEIIDIRHFDAQSFHDLLAAESDAWGVQLHWDYSASARLIASCLDERRLSGYALVSDSHIDGYSFFFYEEEKALIGDLFVQPHGAGLESALRLLRNVLETLLATPGLRRVEAQLPHYAYEDLEPTFRAHGFAAFRRRFMGVALARGDANEGGDGTSSGAASRRKRSAQTRHGQFVIQPWERRHDRQAARLVYEAYRDHVDSIINEQYASLEGTARLIENIVEHRGCGDPVPRRSLVAVHEPTHRLAGALAITAVKPGTAHIPQVAVSAAHQGQGLGTAMVKRAFSELVQDGFEDVSLTVTDDNRSALRLYQTLGFQDFRRFGAFVWTDGENR
jgi:ribosomal protein S18 acetylase RimI-like enzyme